MWRNKFGVAGGVALVLFGVSGAAAANLGTSKPEAGSIVVRAHSVDQAEDTLSRRGYYDIRLERASLPYSFSACKRGVRYHIHVNYYGDLIQVDATGPCDDYGSSYDGRRRYYGRYRD